MSHNSEREVDSSEVRALNTRPVQVGFGSFATDLRVQELGDHVLVPRLHDGIQRVPEHLADLIDAQCRVGCAV